LGGSGLLSARATGLFFACDIASFHPYCFVGGV